MFLIGAAHFKVSVGYTCETLIASYAKRFGETFEEKLFWAARNYTLFYIGGILI